MTTEERRALLDRAITTYGAPAQMDMAVEEMADVQIMLDQLRIIFHRSTEEVEEAKLERPKQLAGLQPPQVDREIILHRR